MNINLTDDQKKHIGKELEKGYKNFYSILPALPAVNIVFWVLFPHHMNSLWSNVILGISAVVFGVCAWFIFRSAKKNINIIKNNKIVSTDKGESFYGGA